ncbi:EKC/KEOPS complex subunit LAGE3-like [Mya arenaria]|uniref:EKC/KEOPS complex subunit LAGE3-like n=1 Tax=Mya arenaria TaxID=6604 RepID=UPI0022E2C0ED|nr:EKC/KEOPS complex subunit LAGE3-like [Mya arenaria]
MTELLSLDLQVPFNTAREAEIAYGTLSVDAEPKRGGTKKIMVVKGSMLTVNFKATEARTLRVAVNSFFDHLNLVVKTIEQFGPPKSVAAET